MKRSIVYGWGLASLIGAAGLAAQGMGGASGEEAAGGMAAGMGAGMGGGSASGEPVDRCAPEFRGQIPNSLAAVDTSGNGAVEKEELAPHVAGGQLDNLFGRWDKDGDGQLSEREFCFRQ